MPAPNDEQKADAAYLGIEIVNSARRWMRLRARLRLLLDSKTAPPALVEQVRVAYNKESNELELLTGKLEKILLLTGRVVPVRRRTKNNFPWQELFTILAKTGAESLNAALNPKPPDGVIDAEIEED